MRFVVTQAPSATSLWTSRIALFSPVLVATAAFLHRLFGMPTPVAFNLVKLAYATAAAALILGLIAAAGIWRNGGAGTARVVVGVLTSLIILAAPLVMLPLIREHPPINDLTTDVHSPPEFGALARVRGPEANPAAYPGERFAKEQAHAYPDLKPMNLDRSRDEAFALAVEAVRRLRMDIVREEAPGDGPNETGMIEAVDRTLIAGFYDDVAIRVAGDDKSARVDIRSASRYGSFDLGRNAERMRALMREILARLDATVPTADDKRASKPSTEEPNSLTKRGKVGRLKSAVPRKPRDRAR